MTIFVQITLTFCLLQRLRDQDNRLLEIKGRDVHSKRQVNEMHFIMICKHIHLRSLQKLLTAVLLSMCKSTVILVNHTIPIAKVS
jgi:hypothetical protein